MNSYEYREMQIGNPIWELFEELKGSREKELMNLIEFRK